MLVLFYTLFSCHKVQAVNIQSASLVRRDLILSNPTTVAPIQEFSTLKLDLTSVSITLDRQTGQRTLHQDISEFNKIKYDDIETESSQTTEASSRTTRDASFAEVLDVTITIDDQDEEFVK